MAPTAPYFLPTSSYKLRAETRVIVIHHSGVSPPQSFEEIAGYHRRPVQPPEGWDPRAPWKPGRGWIDIGYHFLIDPDGTVHVGRPHWAVGAHALVKRDGTTYERNTDGVAICLPGDFSAPGSRPPEAQVASLWSLVDSLLEEYPGADVMGHCESIVAVGGPGYTDCPGDWLVDARATREHTKRWFAGEEPRSSPAPAPAEKPVRAKAPPATKEVQMDKKPTLLQLEQMAAEGEARRDDVVIQSFVVGDNRYYVMDDGTIMDQFAKVRDYPGPDGSPRTYVLEDKRGSQYLVEQASRGLRGVAAVFRSVGTSFAFSTILRLAGLPADRITEKLTALGSKSEIEIVQALMGEVEDRKAARLVNIGLEYFKDDGKMDAVEALAFIEKVKENS